MSERWKKSLKRIFWSVAVGILLVGAAVWVHWQIHGLDVPKVRTQTQIQERKTEQIETITRKIIIEDDGV